MVASRRTLSIASIYPLGFAYP
ncbi:hypothetical protein SPHINGO361_100052 [Sphingomonas sp. EC-HK361]|nr:hypothetical protein SPHINGO361_100052 [Sphingomonas sp. EC-HK361]